MACCFSCAAPHYVLTTLQNALPVSEEAKYELREEVDFSLLRLNAASRHVRHALHMYSRDAAACVRAGEGVVARQLVMQKLLMQRRVDDITSKPAASRPERPSHGPAFSALARACSAQAACL